HLNKSLPYSQFLRVLRNNSQSHQCNLQLETMYNRFQARGYPHNILDEALKRARTAYTLPDSRDVKAANTRSIFPMQYTASVELTSSIRNNWNILALDPTLPEDLRQKPLFCY
ncbi:Hypothetical predicted protein, partial [Pelobates cultripes]